MSTIDSNGVLFYEETDPISPIHTLLNTGQQSVSDALSNESFTSTTRPASPWTGRIIYETNTGNTVQWTGSKWQKIFGPIEGVRSTTGYLNGAIAPGSNTAIVGPSSITLSTTARVRFQFHTNLHPAAASNWGANVVIAVGGVNRVSRRVSGQAAAPTNASVEFEMLLDAGSHSWSLTIQNDPLSTTSVNAVGQGEYSVTW